MGEQRFYTGSFKDLYVLQFQDSKTSEPRTLTPEEKLAGWREARTWDDKPVLLNEWHQVGSLRSRQSSHVLAWEVKPGEKVVATLRVAFSEVLYINEVSKETQAFLKDAPKDIQEQHKYTVGKTILKTVCDPVAHSPEPSTSFLVVLATVIGRSVSLGEDGTEDAFGHNALKEHLEAAVNENDWRRSLCSCQLIEEPDDDTEYENWMAKKKQLRAEVETNTPVGAE